MSKINHLFKDSKIPPRLLPPDIRTISTTLVHHPSCIPPPLSSFKKLSPIDWFPSNPEKEQSLLVDVFSRSSSRNSHEPPRGTSLLENLPPLSKNRVKRSKKRKLRAENNLLRIKGTNSCEIYPWPAHVGFSIGTSTYLAVVKKERNYSIPGSGYTRTVRHVVPSWRRPLEIIDEP